MKISIVIPCYNSMEFVEQCVNSALAQDYDNYDIHAYDNGSTDGTLEYIRKVEEDHDIVTHNPEKIKCIQSGIIGVQEGKTVSRQAHFYQNLEEFKQQCMVRSPVNSPTMVYHKSLYAHMNWSPHGGPAHRYHDIKEAGAGDYDTFCNFADNNIFIYPVNAFLGYFYRWHKGQCTWSVHEEKKTLDYDKVIRNFWKKKWNL